MIVPFNLSRRESRDGKSLHIQIVKWRDRSITCGFSRSTEQADEAIPTFLRSPFSRSNANYHSPVHGYLLLQISASHSKQRIWNRLRMNSESKGLLISNLCQCSYELMRTQFAKSIFKNSIPKQNFQKQESSLRKIDRSLELPENQIIQLPQARSWIQRAQK
jgi:hypothetical protein